MCGQLGILCGNVEDKKTKIQELPTTSVSDFLLQHTMSFRTDE